MGLAQVLLDRKMLLIGNFVLTSGKMSPYYLDLRRFPSYPEFEKFVDAAVKRAQTLKVDVIVGVATGGLPLASFMACRTGTPLAYVRLEKKGHGTDRVLEGDVSGRDALIVDDVATTGSSLERAIVEVAKEGGKPRAALVLVDRQEGARKRLENYGVSLLAVATISDLLNELINSGALTAQEEAAIKDYLVSNVEA
ncbi:orotate phosphoribosyltransferase [Sulfodiicoccus acidiphilus]|uniref:Orotate phosphoribosyltransferase n=1 Tax=Sulfodiicoccus acidiphilus TaxID=1670455 RepID=A0A348B1B0_9CREN|nr:orotate phosphoribosyltransferase [Sulfodiicoccus acidiphilus]BBD71962.1 orotate phosphoribosyltransferase [Sulfodiicoccus acidiphilus]GGT91790.1 orotate phosphoribosyltransferase [Sulfodiicoccus acidiphilus]